MRTFAFLVAIVPLMLGVAVLVLFSLVLASPLMIYASIRGKHLKDPRRTEDSPNEVT